MVEVLIWSKQHFDAPSRSQPVVEKEECQPREGEVDNTAQDLVITVEDVDKGKLEHLQNEVPVSRSEEEEKEEQRTRTRPGSTDTSCPRIVRSYSSYPILSTTSTSPTHSVHSRLKKSSNTKWMAKGATSTPNLRGEVSSCTLEEVISMLLGDSVTDEDDESLSSKSKSPSSSSTTTTKKDLEKRKWLR